jgi:hypothetical protein
MNKPNLHLVGPPAPETKRPKPKPVHVITTPLDAYRASDRILASAQRIRSACSRAFMTETTLSQTLEELEFLREETERVLSELAPTGAELRPQKSTRARSEGAETSRR